MKMLLGITIWLWCLMALILVRSSRTVEGTFDTVSWKLESNPNTYSTFLTSLRTQLSVVNKVVAKVCEIPVTAKLRNNDFVLVDLTSENGIIITLALRASDVYFMGYQDMFNGKYRANFVKDEYDDLVKTNLFSDAKIKEKLPFESGYGDITRVAESSREQLALGVVDLKKIINTVYGKDYTGKNKPKNIGRDLARFALISIQMVAEAARFKYIEDKVKVLGMDGSFKPDSTFVKLENNWGLFSQKIHNSSPGCQPIKVDGFPWSDIKPQFGLMKYKDNKSNLTILKRLISSVKRMVNWVMSSNLNKHEDL